MKATEIVDKLRSVLLSSDDTAEVKAEEVNQEEVNEIEVNEPVELGYDDKKEGMEEDMPSEDVAEESKYATKEELDAAIAEMKAMYDKIMEEMGSQEMETEVPAEELSEEEPAKEELSSQVEEVEPIAHTPEVETVAKQNVRLAQNRPMSTLDRVFAQLNQIKR
jgi:hypothetical protein